MPKNTFTNILATLGPSSSSPEQIAKLIDAGADAFRLNFSHGSHKEHKSRYNLIRRIAKEKGIYITIVADLQGPKLRVGTFKQNKVMLKTGDEFVLDMKNEAGDNKRVSMPHKEIFDAIKVGDELLLNDGNIVLKIKECDSTSATTIVKVGGELSSKKGVNLPNIKLPISALTTKDREDLDFALKIGVDWVCLSFVQSAQDVKEAKELVGGKAMIISKLEKPSAIDELEEIIKLSDGIMVARGDLGVECPIESVPVLQKRIVSTCRRYARPVIIATQMLESMITKPNPTRAEVSDVATAVYEGADTVMLSAETAAGDFPVEAVTTMKNIITQVENDDMFLKYLENTRCEACCSGEEDSITFAAGQVSKVLRNVSAVVTYTMSGKTTMLASKERPRMPIIAITPSAKVAQQLGIVWGATCVVNTSSYKSFIKFEDVAKKVALESGFVHYGDHIVITAGFPIGVGGRTNILHTVHIS